MFPAGDIAVAGAAAALLGLPGRPDPRALRALAARLLWHQWRHMTGRPELDDV